MILSKNLLEQILLSNHMKNIKASEAVMMNRKDRRALGKINNVKIPGFRKPDRKKDEKNTPKTV